MQGKEVCGVRSKQGRTACGEGSTYAGKAVRRGGSTLGKQSEQEAAEVCGGKKYAAVDMNCRKILTAVRKGKYAWEISMQK